MHLSPMLLIFHAQTESAVPILHMSTVNMKVSDQRLSGIDLMVHAVHAAMTGCRWLQSSANPLLPALSLLEGLAAFIVLCPSLVVQQLTSKLLLFAQLLKACLGTMTVADAAVAVLCLTLVNDSMVVAALRRVRELYAGKQPTTPADGEDAAVGAAAAELLAYKPNGDCKRRLSADSLASLLSGDMTWRVVRCLSQLILPPRCHHDATVLACHVCQVTCCLQHSHKGDCRRMSEVLILCWSCWLTCCLLLCHTCRTGSTASCKPACQSTASRTTQQQDQQSFSWYCSSVSCSDVEQ